MSGGARGAAAAPEALPVGGPRLRDKYAFEVVADPARGGLPCFECLGRGSFGTVFVVRHTETGERLAAKRISESEARGHGHAWDEVKVYASEVARLRGLADEIAHTPDAAASIVRFVDGFYEPGAPGARDAVISIVMELSPVAVPKLVPTGGLTEPSHVGGSAMGSECDATDHPLCKAPLDWDRLREVLRQLLKALSFWHSKGMIHRDVKPDNLLVFAVSAAGHPLLKMSDFGLSRLYDPAGMTFKKLGTPAYRAPELHQPHYTSAVDLFSTGCALFALRANRLPSDKTTLAFPERFFQDTFYETYDGQSRADWDAGKVCAVDACSQLTGYLHPPAGNGWETLLSQLRMLLGYVSAVPGAAAQIGTTLLSALRRLGVAQTHTSVFFEAALLPADVHNAAAYELGMKSIYAHFPPGSSSLDLFQRLTTANPADRISASAALFHPFMRGL